VKINASFAASPASEWILVGGITSTSAQFRIALDSAMIQDKTNDPLFLLVSNAPNLMNPIFSQGLVVNENITVTATTDTSSILSIAVENLEPATIYYYGMIRNDNPNGNENILLPGRFKTFGPENEPYNFTVALASCAQTGSKSVVFDEITAENADVFIHMGDLHYEDITENNLQKRLDAVSTVLASSQQAQLYRSTGLVYMYDDHDFGANDAGADFEIQGARDTALRSYQIAIPHYPLAAQQQQQQQTSTLNTSQALANYQAFTIGTVRFLLSDLRSEATANAMYSAEQREWLRTELAQAANYDFVIWITTKPWIGEPESGDDAWMGYANDRQELSDWIQEVIGDANQGPQNLLAVSGDAHMLAFDDGTNTYYGSSADNNVSTAANSTYSFPILQSGPLHRLGSVKGGPFSDGCTTKTLEVNHQYSTIQFTFVENQDPCMEITAYTIDDSIHGVTKSIVFQKRLCGKIFSPSQANVREGTCKAQQFSTSNIILFAFSVGLAVAFTIVSCVGVKKRFWFSMFVFFAYVVVMAVGFGVYFAKGYGDVLDLTPTLSILVAQSAMFLLYALYLLWQRKRLTTATFSDIQKAPWTITDNDAAVGFDEELYK
jgi:hypothetical protein